MTSSRTKRTSGSLERSLERIEQRHRALARELADIGIVLRGSIAVRSARCGQPICCCKADPPKLHGPYNFWSRKVAGKTVNVILPSEQAARCQQWSRNMRRTDKILRQMQALGLLAAQAVRRHS